MLEVVAIAAKAGQALGLASPYAGQPLAPAAPKDYSSAAAFPELVGSVGLELAGAVQSWPEAEAVAASPHRHSDTVEKASFQGFAHSSVVHFATSGIVRSPHRNGTFPAI